MKELTKKCIGLISNTLVQLGQTKSDKDILILASTLAEDLMRDFGNMRWNDVEEAFRSLRLKFPPQSTWINFRVCILQEEHARQEGLFQSCFHAS